MFGILPLVPPLAPLYAEIHYRFPYFMSFLSKPEPEVVADAPHRVEPGQPIPILLLAKDGDRHPAVLRDAVATLRSGDQERCIAFTSAPIHLRDHWWWTVCEAPTDGMHGWVDCDVRFTIDAGHGARAYANDNYRTTSHAPLRVFVSREPLPRIPGLLLGEGHSHSHATSDQVEFGAPPGAARALGKRLGLDFACITDHSYDLDDRGDDYLHNDPLFPKWKDLRHEIEVLNESLGMVLVCGEEVTCRNASGRNIHCLVLGDEQFHPGSGDSAERWLRTRSELSVEELLDRVSPNAAVIAAHIRERVPFLQRLLLGRGRWEDNDLRRRGLHAIQFWNGATDHGFESGRSAWVQALLEGHRLGILAGNAAHGNFNRFRQLSVPFVALRESDHQLFGRVRLGVLASERSDRAIVDAARSRKTIATDGPVAVLSDSNGRHCVGEMLQAPASLTIEARSSSEFGGLAEVLVWKGHLGSKSEELLQRWNLDGARAWRDDLTVEDLRPHYIRVEVRTHPGEQDGRSHRCLTSPVWFGV